MRFLILTQYFPPEIGAAHTRLRAIASELRRAGHEVEVVTAMPNYPLGRIFPEYRGRFYLREVRDGIVVHRVWIYAAMGGGLARVLNYSSFVLLSVFGLMRAKRPNYLFIESPPLPLTLPGHLFAQIWGVPSIMNVADLWPEAAVEMGFVKHGSLVSLIKILERWSYRHATFINAMTTGIQQSLRDKSVPAEKILFFPNGVDTAHYQPRPIDIALKEALGLSAKKVLIYPGTHGSAHGLDLVLQAAKLLEHESDIHFLFLGDGSERAQLERLGNELRLRNITFRDPVPIEELPRYLSIAECGLVSLRDLPHLSGARPAKLFPLLAAGKPIIFVGKGEGAQLAEQAKAAVVVPPGNPQALAAAISGLIRNPDAIEELGKNGRHFAETNLQWSRLVREWISELCRPRVPLEAVANTN